MVLYRKNMIYSQVAMVGHLQIGGYEIEPDKDATAAAYSRIPAPGPEQCGCAYCHNCVAGREHTMPRAVRALLSQLGIPLNGEIEVYEFPGGAKPHGYGGWYMFAGWILSKPPEDTNMFTLDGIRVWFTSGLSFRVPAFDGDGTCELQFITEVDEYLKQEEYNKIRGDIPSSSPVKGRPQGCKLLTRAGSKRVRFYFDGIDECSSIFPVHYRRRCTLLNRICQSLIPGRS